MGRDRYPRFAVCALVLALCAVGLAGCPQALDTSAIKKIVTSTTDAGASFDALFADYYGTCVRYQEYTSTAFARDPLLPPSPSPTPAPSPAAPGAPPPPIPTPTPTLVTLPEAPGEDTSCVEAYALSQRWALYNKGVVAYIQALGALAGVNTKPSNLDKLAGELKSAHFIDAATSNAAGAFGTTIAAWIFQGQQKIVMADAIKSANPDLPTVLDALKQVATSYDTLQIDEQTELNDLYSSALERENEGYQNLSKIAASKKRPRREDYPANSVGDARYQTALARFKQAELQLGTLRLTILNQRAEWQTRATTIDSNRRVAAAYMKFLDAVGKAQKSLYEKANSGGGSAQFFDVLGTYAADIDADLAAMQKQTKK